MNPDDFDLDPAEIRPQYRRPTYGASLWEVGHRKVAAWTERQLLEADRSVLASQQRLVEQKVSLALTELNGRTAISNAFAEAEEAAAEVEFARSVREMRPADARAYIATETETERRLTQRSAYRTARHNRAGERFLPPAPTSKPEAEVAIEVSEAEIERHALLGFARLASAPQAMQKDEQAAFAEEVRSKLPDFAAEDVLSRVGQMLERTAIAR